MAVPIDFDRADELTDWIKANLTTLKTVYREPHPTKKHGNRLVLALGCKKEAALTKAFWT